MTIKRFEIALRHSLKGEILEVILKEYGIKKTQGYSEIRAAQKMAKDLYYAD